MNAMPKKKMLLHSEAILNYLLHVDDEIDTLVTCKTHDTDLEATDFELYEAIGSIEPAEFNYHRLVKFLESVRIVPDTNKRPLTHERVDQLRERVLARKEGRESEKRTNGDGKDA